MKANVIKINFPSCLGACWGREKANGSRTFHVDVDEGGVCQAGECPLQEVPAGDGVVLGPPPEVWSLHRVCLPSSACGIPRAESLMTSVGCGSVIGTLVPTEYTASLGSGVVPGSDVLGGKSITEKSGFCSWKRGKESDLG